jgi:cytochrome c1
MEARSKEAAAEYGKRMMIFLSQFLVLVLVLKRLLLLAVGYGACNRI